MFGSNLGGLMRQIIFSKAIQTFAVAQGNKWIPVWLSRLNGKGQVAVNKSVPARSLPDTKAKRLLS